MRKLLQVMALALAFALVPVAVAHAATPAQENAACAAVYHYHHVNADEYANEPLWQAAYHHAWHEANYADREMRLAIHFYLKTDTRWSGVVYACYPDK